MKTFERKILPVIMRRIQRILAQAEISAMKLGLRIFQRHSSRTSTYHGFRIDYTDNLSFYMECKDIFFHQIYRFEAHTSTPYIIDGGGCIGMSVLYFKSIYPQARILCFEPDDKLFYLMQKNFETNHISNVELIQAALTGSDGSAYFQADESDQGKILPLQDKGKMQVKTVRLSSYLTTPVDFLKLNIEGQELPVLQEAEASGMLRNVREMVIEYHGWADAEQRLGDLLNLLARNGYRYLVHDFDAETCSASKPPFRLRPATAWFCLVYAKQVSSC
ncbi:methyltransferase FkbM family [Candidatus Moduliflexus flocculans]|uniref:Methyltransferase FkbM family n=1 Tax=Candidatus Moduliflexus flocculans TaxID=1499966 RepID=A0A081BMV6_9BACT|nr:methyltransferase FkbM family [Candidatus Moduliflexus flocculans]